MNTLLSFSFVFLIGNVAGLTLWGMQSVDWYRNSDLFKFLVVLTSLTFIKLIWLFFYKTPVKSNIYLTGSVLVSWILVCLWVVASVFVTSITSECMNIYSNYYKYSNGNGFLTCNGEIATTTFTILLTLMWLIISVYMIQLYKVPREQEVTVIERPQMQEVQSRQNVEIEMEEVSL